MISWNQIENVPRVSCHIFPIYKLCWFMFLPTYMLPNLTKCTGAFMEAYLAPKINESYFCRIRYLREQSYILTWNLFSYKQRLNRFTQHAHNQPILSSIARNSPRLSLGCSFHAGPMGIGNFTHIKLTCAAFLAIFSLTKKLMGKFQIKFRT